MENYFQTDQQTLDDLMIFGQPGKKSIFELFDNTYTRGGGNKLKEMFRYPMVEPEEIKTRLGLLKYLSEEAYEFPFRRDLFDTIDKYLDDHDKRSKLTRETLSMKEKVMGMVATDPKIKAIQAGVKAVWELIREIQEFVSQLPQGEKGLR